MSSKTLVEAFQETALAHNERVALRSIDGASSLTWGELAEAVERAAGSLAALGLRRGDRLALLSRNRSELLIADLAAMHLGAAPCALFVTSPAEAIATTLSTVRPRMVLAERDLLGQAPPVAEVHPLDGSGSALRHERRSGFDFAGTWRQVRPEDPASALLTSGTTGLPKAVVWSHAGALGWARAFQRCSPEPGHVHDLSVAPFASAAERAAGHWRSLVTGGTRTLCRDPAALIEALRSARPTFLFGSPRLWQGVLRYLEDLESPSPLAEAGLERISWAITAGASCPPALRWRLLDLGVPLRELYGMTETGGATITAATVDDIGTVGQPVPGLAGADRPGRRGPSQSRSPV